MHAKCFLGFFLQAIHDSSRPKSRSGFPDLNPEKALKIKKNIDMFVFARRIYLRLQNGEIPTRLGVI